MIPRDDGFQGAELACRSRLALQLCLPSFCAMFADTDTGNSNHWLHVNFVIIEEDVAINLVVEADFGAIYLGAEVMGVAKGKLCVGACLGELQLDGAGFAVAVLQVTAAVIEEPGTAQ